MAIEGILPVDRLVSEVHADTLSGFQFHDLQGAVIPTRDGECIGVECTMGAWLDVVGPLCPMANTGPLGRVLVSMTEDQAQQLVDVLSSWIEGRER